MTQGLSCSVACGIFLDQGSHYVSCISWWILYHWATMEAWKILLLFFSPFPYWRKKKKKKFSTTDRAGAQRFKSNAMLMRHCIYIKLHGQTFKILCLLLSFSSITCLQTFSSNQISPCYRVNLIILIYLYHCLGWYKFLKGLLRTVWALSLRCCSLFVIISSGCYNGTS